eukprot:4862058-Lingulodinium_polyedra.AAC.1
MPACSIHQHTATMFHCHCRAGRRSPCSTCRRSQCPRTWANPSGALPTTARSVSAAAVPSSVLWLLDPAAPWSCLAAHARTQGPTSSGE